MFYPQKVGEGELLAIKSAVRTYWFSHWFIQVGIDLTFFCEHQHVLTVWDSNFCYSSGRTIDACSRE